MDERQGSGHFVGIGEDTVQGDARSYESIAIAAPRTRDFDDPEYDPLLDDGNLGVNVVVRTSTSTGQMTGVSRSLTGTDDTVRFRAVDFVIGTFRNDLFSGGRGNDRFRPNSGDDGIDGGAGFDTVHYDTSSIFETRVDLALGEAVKGFAVGSSSSRSFFYDGLRDVEAVVGAPAGRDVLLGSSVASRLDGQGGDDRLDGRNGADTLIGGDDDDRLVGGGGRDRFVFDGDDGEDRIADFANRSDRIQITDGAARFSDLSIAQVGRHAVVSFSETAVTLLRTNVSVLDASDFVFG